MGGLSDVVSRKQANTHQVAYDPVVRPFRDRRAVTAVSQSGFVILVDDAVIGKLGTVTWR